MLIKGGVGRILFQLQKETVFFLNLFRSKVPNLGYKKEAKRTGASTLPEKRRASPPIYVLPLVRLWSCDSKRKKQYGKNPSIWPVRWKLPQNLSANTGRMSPFLHLLYNLLIPVQQVGLAYDIWSNLYSIWQKVGWLRNKRPSASLIYKK